MHLLSPFRPARLAFTLAFVASLPVALHAQGFPPGAPGQAMPGQNPAALSVRIDRLENRIRELTGQVEELQFQMRRMEEQLQRFQQDVDYRMQERGGPAPAARTQPQRRSDVPPPTTGQGLAPAGAGQPLPQVEIIGEGAGDPRQQATLEPRVIPAPGVSGQAVPGQAVPGGRRGDAFDPDANPSAPGAPRVLSGTPGPYVPSAPRRLPGGPLDPNERLEPVEDPGAPLDLSRPGTARPQQARPQVDPGAGVPSSVGVLPGVPGQASVGVLPGVPSQIGNPGAGQPAGQPQNRYQLALAAVKESRFEEAEREFQAFIEQNPKSRLVPDAIFNIGMTYERRGRHREAAEQYLKVTQSHDKSTRAPESMLRLGLALERLGAKEQACATWQEASRKYPQAPGTVRTGLERQIKRAQCA
jgi:tol-pal system protein YbgF